MVRGRMQRGSTGRFRFVRSLSMASKLKEPFLDRLLERSMLMRKKLLLSECPQKNGTTVERPNHNRKPPVINRLIGIGEFNLGNDRFEQWKDSEQKLNLINSFFSISQPETIINIISKKKRKTLN
ncbi:hypothetical protein NPIL_548661 [Nephila pilipes]|uniref:Uncharacterized protein n=1 Tax=Nephila pilipes TaxID=299642 RepID=A0A8X6NEI3_NEPPI|nr:hypothetical protein NPIL_548661 [Nephila pilipes]